MSSRTAFCISCLVQRQVRASCSYVPVSFPHRSAFCMATIASIQIPRVVGEHFDRSGSPIQSACSNFIQKCLLGFGTGDSVRCVRGLRLESDETAGEIAV